MGYIYKITNLITNQVYIGQTKNNPIVRWNREKRDASNSLNNTLLAKNFREYGFDNFQWEVVEECSNENLDDKEKYWINYYQSFNSGLNMTRGGNGSPSFVKLNPKTLEEIINLLQENILTNRDIANRYSISEQLVCAINTGRMWYQNNLDYPLRKKEHKQKQLQPKWYDNIDIEQTKIEYAKKIYETSIRQAAMFFNLTDNGLKKRCIKLGLPSKSLEIKNWYRENILHLKPIIKEKPKEKPYTAIEQYDLNGNLLNTFSSVTEAGRSVKTTSGHIGEVCRGKRKTAGGYIWRYKDD